MRFVRVCALLCFAALTGAMALADGQFFDVSQVADGVYAAIGKNGAFCNAAVIVNRNDVLVVDTHLRPVWAHDLIQQIKKMTDKPVRYVVNTHWHPDHVQGNEAYVNVFGPTVEYLAQHNTREDMIHKAIPSIQDSLKDLPEAIAKMEKTLADGKDAQGQPLTDEQRANLQKQIEDQKAYLGELRQMQITLPTITFERSLYLHKPGERTIQVLYFGKGHTRGDVVVYLPKEKVVATGDLLTNGIPFMRDAYPVEWGATLEAIEKLDWTVAIPGHGDAQQGKAQIGKLISFMKDLVTQVKAAVAQGRSLEETKKAVNLSSHAPDFPVYKTPAAFQRTVDSAVERCWTEVSGKIVD
ncbi:MAG TPA: MBL fold metallo-hydrolase [Candidatus Acidoferrales bacterium]|nr:MBL fold metallo-hydrolase [Candidatus Acidoferrales bacterium]